MMPNDFTPKKIAEWFWNDGVFGCHELNLIVDACSVVAREEREACAKVIEECRDCFHYSDQSYQVLDRVVADIRARKNSEAGYPRMKDDANETQDTL